MAYSRCALLKLFPGQNEDQSVNEAVRQEAAEHPDLLVGGFDDSYKNLVFKTLWLIEWAANT